MTQLLVKKMGCFTEVEARKIAFYTQEVDYDPATTPGPGWVPILPGPLKYLSWAKPDQRQMQVNMDYHALHPGSHQPYLDRLWPQGLGFDPSNWDITYIICKTPSATRVMTIRCSLTSFFVLLLISTSLLIFVSLKNEVVIK